MFGPRPSSACTGRGPLKRSAVLNGIAVTVGVGAAIVMITLAGLPSPLFSPQMVLIATTGMTFRVPAFDNATARNGGLAACQQQHDCGFPGLSSVQFHLRSNYRLSGILMANGTVELDVYNIATPYCGWGEPQPNCTVRLGTYSYGWSISPNLDLGAANVNLPAGDWTFSLANYSTVVVTVTVVQSVVANRA